MHEVVAILNPHSEDFHSIFLDLVQVLSLFSFIFETFEVLINALTMDQGVRVCKMVAEKDYLFDYWGYEVDKGLSVRRVCEPMSRRPVSYPPSLH